MGVMERVSQLMTSDIDHLLERAKDPEATIAQLIGDLEESILDLRRETVTAVARQNRLRQQLFTAEEAAGRVERQASVALTRGEELQARYVLSREIAALKARDDLEAKLAEAGSSSARLVAALIRMEDRAQLARRKQNELARQRRVTGDEPARRGAEGAMSAIRQRFGLPGRSHAFDGYTEAVGALEHEAARPTDEEGGGRC